MTVSPNDTIIQLWYHLAIQKEGERMTSTSKLKVRRVEMGFKQKELAEVANVSIAYMARLENGKAKNPSIEIMKKLANALKTTPQELFF